MGDMDFKVAAPRTESRRSRWISKSRNRSGEILERALAQALREDFTYLTKMNEVLAAPREHLSPYAPKIVQFTIDPDKIREVIGSGGKVINKIIDDTGVKIDIEDDGRVAILTPDDEAAAKARKIIETIAKDVKVGEVFNGKVTRIMNFGAFCGTCAGQGRDKAAFPTFPRIM